MGKSVLGKDISNKSVVIVLVLVILVTIIGLGIYLNTIQNAEPKISSISQGKVSLGIEAPPAKEAVPSVSNTGGKVSLGIEKAPE